MSKNDPSTNTKRGVNVDPTPNGHGRDPKTGQFLPGHPFATGDPYAARRQEWQRVLYRAMSPAAVLRVFRALIKKAEEGESWAVKELADRVLGKAVQPIDAQVSVQGLTPLLEALRQRLEERALSEPHVIEQAPIPALPDSTGASNTAIDTLATIRDIAAPDATSAEIVDPGAQTGRTDPA